MIEKLIVIGNGFDIAHGIPSRYEDFKEYLLLYEKEPEVLFEIAGQKWCASDSISPNDVEKRNFYEDITKFITTAELWSDFENALGYLDDEELKSYHSDFLLDYGHVKWKDSANHDYQMSIEESLEFAKDIPKYLAEWISHLNTSADNILPPNFINNEALFLNFNYTDTLEEVYGILRKNILYIHGKCKEGSHLVVGHHDSNLFMKKPVPAMKEEYKQYMDLESGRDFREVEAENIIKSYFKSTYKNVYSIIRDNITFFKNLGSVKEVLIMGHSLSKIDMEYFSMIRQYANPDCIWHITFHSEDDRVRAQEVLTELGIKNGTLRYW